MTRPESVAKIDAPTKANILVVDDKPKNLVAMAEMLDELGENVVRVGSGVEALRFLLHYDAAIVLVDVQMPDIDGYELAALIRGRERSRLTPIIFITAFGRDDHDISRAYRLGAVDYVFKPIDPVVLRAKVSVFVGLHKMTQRMREQVEHERLLQHEASRARSEKVEAERALRQIEERQSLIIRSLPIALYTVSLADGFDGPRFLSEGIAESVGFPVRAFIDDPALWAARVNPDDLPDVLLKLDTIADTGTISTEYRWRCADGSERIFLDQAILVRDGDTGAASEIVGTCLDITYRRQLERQLHQSQKMEAVGQLTGGIAHDFNNMLSVIIWNLDLISRSLKGGGKDHDRAQNALAAALNCAELVRHLLTFARHQPHRNQVIDLVEILPRIARLLNPVVGEGVTLEIALDDAIWPISADRAMIESALVNLALNARDAMPGGGTLSITGANIVVNASELEPEAGDYVMLAVTDSGIGMPQHIVDRAFEPFFTTKEEGRGTGLGLSMVYGFVKQSGGHIAIESTVGVGTTVRLYFPRVALSSVVDPEIAQPEPTIEELPFDVLVVEDNASIRRMTVERLRELGARVVEADSAPAAVEILKGDSPIQLLLTDVVMPGGMSGLELAHQSSELRPGIKVVLASGFAGIFPTTGGVASELLQKPYRDEDLVRAIRRALCATQSESGVAVEGNTAQIETTVAR